MLSLIFLGNSLLASGGEGHSEGGWMEKWLSFDEGIFLWTVVTFLVVLVILRWKAWGPLMDALDKRESDIREALGAADKAREEAEKMSHDYEEMVKKARAEAQQIVANGKVTAERVKSSIEDDARLKAADLLEKAKIQINAERDKAIGEIRSAVVDLSLQAATKVIEKNLDSADNRRLIDQTLSEIGKA